MNSSLLNAVSMPSQLNRINLDLGGQGDYLSYNIKDYESDISILYRRKEDNANRPMSINQEFIPVNTSIGLAVLDNNGNSARLNINMYPKIPSWSELTLLSRLTPEQLGKVNSVVGTLTRDNYDIVLNLIDIFVEK